MGRQCFPLVGLRFNDRQLHECRVVGCSMCAGGGLQGCCILRFQIEDVSTCHSTRRCDNLNSDHDYSGQRLWANQAVERNSVITCSMPADLSGVTISYKFFSAHMSHCVSCDFHFTMQMHKPNMYTYMQTGDAHTSCIYRVNIVIYGFVVLCNCVCRVVQLCLSCYATACVVVCSCVCRVIHEKGLKE